MTKARARSHNRPPAHGRGKLRRALRVGVWLAAAALAGSAGRAEADDPVMIHVRGRTQLRLSEGERRTPDGEHFQLTVHVRLDDGQPLTGAAAGDGSADSAADEQTKGSAADPARSFAGQRVQLRLSGPDGELGPRTLTTGADGRAVLPLTNLPLGSYTLAAEYAGDELRDAARADLTVDLGRQPVSLTLQVPPQVARTGELPLELRLQSEDHGLTATVQLRVGDVLHPVPVVQGFAKSTLRLRPLLALRKGQVLSVIASYPGDRLHGSALQRRDVLLTSQAQVTLALASPAAGPGAAEIAQGGSLTAVGVVSDEDGPLAGEPVDLEVSEQPGGERAEPTGLPGEPAPRAGRVSASGISDSQGRFRIVLHRLPLHPGPAVLAAQVTPHYRYILPARAAELPLIVLPPEPISALPYVLPLLASALGALLWLAGRRLRPHLQRLGEALRRRLRPPRTEPVVANPAAASQELPASEPGVSLSHGRRLAGLTLRRTIDTTIDGQVVDASFGRPVAGAVLTVESATPPTAPGSDSQRLPQLPATAEGRFTSQLPPGRYFVVVNAPGYLPQRFPAASPHRGELRGVSVRLEPIRVRLLGEWRRVAQRLLGQETRLRTATPRELLEQFSRLRGAPALTYGSTARELRRLTELCEQAYYSPRVCTPEMLVEAARLADLLLASGATPSVPLPGAAPPTAGPLVPLG